MIDASPDKELERMLAEMFPPEKKEEKKKPGRRIPQKEPERIVEELIREVDGLRQTSVLREEVIPNRNCVLFAAIEKIPYQLVSNFYGLIGLVVENELERQVYFEVDGIKRQILYKHTDVSLRTNGNGFLLTLEERGGMKFAEKNCVGPLMITAKEYAKILIDLRLGDLKKLTKTLGRYEIRNPIVIGTSHSPVVSYLVQKDARVRFA